MKRLSTTQPVPPRAAPAGAGSALQGFAEALSLADAEPGALTAQEVGELLKQEGLQALADALPGLGDRLAAAARAHADFVRWAGLPLCPVAGPAGGAGRAPYSCSIMPPWHLSAARSLCPCTTPHCHPPPWLPTPRRAGLGLPPSATAVVTNGRVVALSPGDDFTVGDVALLDLHAQRQQFAGEAAALVGRALGGSADGAAATLEQQQATKADPADVAMVVSSVLAAHQPEEVGRAWGMHGLPGAVLGKSARHQRLCQSGSLKGRGPMIACMSGARAGG